MCLTHPRAFILYLTHLRVLLWDLRLPSKVVVVVMVVVESMLVAVLLLLLLLLQLEVGMRGGHGLLGTTVSTPLAGKAAWVRGQAGWEAALRLVEPRASVGADVLRVRRHTAPANRHQRKGQ
eukprot:1161136-Pelagomonas_calceolata.AAC.4